MKPSQYFLNYVKFLEACNDAKGAKEQLDALRNLLQTVVTITQAGYHQRLIRAFEVRAQSSMDVQEKELCMTMQKLASQEADTIVLIAGAQNKLPFFSQFSLMIDHKDSLPAGYEKDELDSTINHGLTEYGCDLLIKGASMMAKNVKHSIPFIIDTLQALNPKSELLKEEMPSLN